MKARIIAGYECECGWAMMIDDRLVSERESKYFVCLNDNCEHYDIKFKRPPPIELERAE